jgi:hypothetical protein
LTFAVFIVSARDVARAPRACVTADMSPPSLARRRVPPRARGRSIECRIALIRNDPRRWDS